MQNFKPYNDTGIFFGNRSFLTGGWFFYYNRKQKQPTGVVQNAGQRCGEVLFQTASTPPRTAGLWGYWQISPSCGFPIESGPARGARGCPRLSDGNDQETASGSLPERDVRLWFYDLCRSFFRVFRGTFIWVKFQQVFNFTFQNRT